MFHLSRGVDIVNFVYYVFDDCASTVHSSIYEHRQFVVVAVGVFLNAGKTIENSSRKRPSHGPIITELIIRLRSSALYLFKAYTKCIKRPFLAHKRSSRSRVCLNGGTVWESSGKSMVGPGSTVLDVYEGRWHPTPLTNHVLLSFKRSKCNLKTTSLYS